MACCHRHQLFAPAEEEWVVADEKPAGVRLDEGGKGSLQFVLSAGLQNMELHSLCTRRFLHVSHHALSS